MKKGTILFPLFTSRQTERNEPQKQNKTGRVKSKESSSLLKLISEDIERTKQLRKQKSQRMENLLKQKQNNMNCNPLRRLNGLTSQKRGQRMPSLQIHKIAKTQTYKTIIPEVTNDKASRGKATAVSISARRNSTNIKLSGQRVVVVQKRKEFSKINEELIYDRRQNYLNSKFNDRVNRLNSITKQNKRIYDRINSQQSHYSKDDLNKSYESNASISKRLSNSKISQRSRLSMCSQRSVSSSRCSMVSKKSAKSIKYQEGFHSRQVLKGKAATKRLIKIESKNINELKAQQFQNFATLFASTNNVLLQNKRTQSITARKQKDSSELKENVEIVVQSKQKMRIKPKENSSLLPSLVKFSKDKQSKQNGQIQGKQRVSSIRKQILSAIDENRTGMNINLCDNLHKIVEQPTLPTKKIFNPSLKR